MGIDLNKNLYSLFVSSGERMINFCEHEYKNHKFPNAETMEAVLRRTEDRLMREHNYPGIKNEFYETCFRYKVFSGEIKL